MSETRRALLLTHSLPDQTREAAARAAALAGEAGWELVAEAEEIEKLGKIAGLVEGAVDGCELCLVLGGDGTILRALRLFADKPTAVYGINFGTIGFLAAGDRDGLDSALSSAYAGEYDEMQLPALEASIDGQRTAALNDLSLLRRQHGRVAELSYRLGGREVGHVRCDGLVASTPAGSTGYNLANGGPILAWGVEGYVVSFVSPHSLTARPLVVAPDDVLHVLNAAGRDAVEVVVDGRPMGELPAGAELAVGFRDDVSRLATAPGSNFYERIKEKFGQLAR